MENLLDFESFNERNNLTKYEKDDMSSIGERGTGINGVSVWFGNVDYIKVSNILYEKSGKDCFTITLPNLKEYGRNKNIITDKIFENIIRFINLNKDSIMELSRGEINDYVFFKKIIKL